MGPAEEGTGSDQLSGSFYSPSPRRCLGSCQTRRPHLIEGVDLRPLGTRFFRLVVSAWCGTQLCCHLILQRLAASLRDVEQHLHLMMTGVAAICLDRVLRTEEVVYPV